MQNTGSDNLTRSFAIYEDFSKKVCYGIAWEKSLHIWQMRRPLDCKVFIQSKCKRIIQPVKKCIKNAHPARKIPDRKKTGARKNQKIKSIEGKGCFSRQIEGRPCFSK
jgi:hypothetical protein